MAGFVPRVSARGGLRHAGRLRSALLAGSGHCSGWCRCAPVLPRRFLWQRLLYLTIVLKAYAASLACAIADRPRLVERRRDCMPCRDNLNLYVRTDDRLPVPSNPYRDQYALQMSRCLSCVLVLVVPCLDINFYCTKSAIGARCIALTAFLADARMSGRRSSQCITCIQTPHSEAWWARHDATCVSACRHATIWLHGLSLPGIQASRVPAM